MKKIVFCWEMGGNYGHIAGFLPLYRELKKQGADVYCILRSLEFVHLLGPEAISKCFQAPSPILAPVKREVRSYADILACIGYLDERVLSRYLFDWGKLLENIGPDVIIVDHAPTASLAARVLRIPVAAIGTGFINPPGTHTFPPFFPEKPSTEINLSEQILKVINKVLTSFHTEIFEYIGDIFSYATQFLCTFSELDHYGVRHDGNYCGPLYADEIGDVFSWPNAEKKIFAYLTPQVKNIALALTEISRLPGFKLIHVPGLNADLQQHFLGRSDLHIHSTPVRMDSLLKQVDLVICQGGIGLSSQCFMRGITQVLVPTQVEQRMLARRMLVQQLAFAVDPNLPNPPYEDVLSKSLESSVVEQNCAAIKDKYQHFSQQDQILKMTETIFRLG